MYRIPGGTETFSLGIQFFGIRTSCTHIERTYPVIFRINKESDMVLVLDLMTIEQAHIRYGRYS
jgi:hypothetical protein